jgi:hypothetical protein
MALNQRRHKSNRHLITTYFVNSTTRDVFPRNPQRMNIHRGDDQGLLNRAIAIRGKSSLAVLVAPYFQASMARIVNSQICAVICWHQVAVVGPLEQ